MRVHTSALKSCPRCGSAEKTARVRSGGAVSQCANCGLRSTLLRQAEGSHFVVARPSSQQTTHTSHPHHYIAVMILFLVFALIVIAMAFSQLVAAR